jgi:membrane protease YdiL (CAAX protease family)
MWQNKLPYYTVKAANAALMTLLLAYCAIDLAEVAYLLLSGQVIDMNLAIITRLLADIPVVVIAVTAARPGQALRFRGPGLRNIVYTLLLAFFSYLAIQTLLNLAAWMIQSSGHTLPEDLLGDTLAQMPFIVEFMTYCVFAPLTEEILFRGMIQNAFERRVGFAAFVIAGILFGWMHAEPLSILNGALTGFLLGYLYLSTRSLWTPLLYHAFYNLMAFTLAPNIFIMRLPWALDLHPAGPPDFSDPGFAVYSAGVAAIGVLMTYVTLRLLRMHNGAVRPQKAAWYFPEPGATPMLIVILALLALRTLPGILAYGIL